MKNYADLIKFSDDTLTIVHVKDNFDGDMRVLDRQVEMSIRMLMDIQNNTQFFEELYNKANNSNQNKRTMIEKEFKSSTQFIEKIKNSKPRYVIVIRPAKKDLIKNRSNTAKHCLNALIDRCFRRGIELNIQIK